LAQLPFKRPFTCAWLANNTKDKKDKEAVLHIPKKTNGEEHTLEGLIGDQTREAMGHILNKTYKWLGHIRGKQECNPLRLTVSGAGGSGKSVLTNTIGSVLGKAFGRSNAVHVCGPTGSAAFNAGGVTTHWLFGIGKRHTTNNLNANKQKKLLQDFANTTCLVVDERSVMSAALLGMMEHCAKMTAHKGTNTHKEWGGIPVVILVGDDYQLPSIDLGASHVNARASECDNTDNQVGHKQSF
jgi:hypothetical protein